MTSSLHLSLCPKHMAIIHVYMYACLRKCRASTGGLYTTYLNNTQSQNMSY